MSWKIEDTGTASFQSGSWQLICDTNDPRAGVVLASTTGDISAPASELPALFRLLPSEGAEFPPLDECYVRRNDLVCRYPQTTDQLFGLEVCHRVLLIDYETIGIETICSVQTNLLDSHPTFDVVSSWKLSSNQLSMLDAEGKTLSDRNPVTLDFPSQTKTPPAISRLELNQLVNADTLLLILPPSDRSVASVIEESDHQHALRYRLLAEFMEKGVIRKARIWTVICKQSPSESQVLGYYQRLLEEPLPLTP